MLPWIRLNRVIRDIPNQYIEGGNDITNMRQYLQKKLKDNGEYCKCIRCREVGLNSFSKKGTINSIPIIRKYNDSGGTEYFISFESEDERLIYGFIRLRLSKTSGSNFFDELKNTALIRELHVYGQLIPTYSKERKKDIQHSGLGTKLIILAEKISVNNGYKSIAVIAGIGTRNYYRKFGYKN